MNKTKKDLEIENKRLRARITQLEAQLKQFEREAGATDSSAVGALALPLSESRDQFSPRAYTAIVNKCAGHVPGTWTHEPKITMLLDVVRVTNQEWSLLKHYGPKSIKCLKEILAQHGLKPVMNEFEIAEYVRNFRDKPPPPETAV